MRATTLMFNFLLIACVFILIRCANHKAVTYFADQGDAELEANNLPPLGIIQKNDLLHISVTSLSATTSNIFNTANLAGSLNNNNPAMQTNGYLVDHDGNIKLPYLGKMKVEGVSSSELEDIITNEILAKKLMIEPIVTVRHINFKVTVLGEVGRPLVINVPNEKISILEAIGMAGDLTIYAKRDNVLLIREENGKKVTRRLNLNSNSILQSPYYYLKSNDVIYVEPNEAKIASTSKARQSLPVVFGALSFVVVLIDRLTR